MQGADEISQRRLNAGYNLVPRTGIILTKQAGGWGPRAIFAIEQPAPGTKGNITQTGLPKGTGKMGKAIFWMSFQSQVYLSDSLCVIAALMKNYADQVKDCQNDQA